MMIVGHHVGGAGGKMCKRHRERRHATANAPARRFKNNKNGIRGPGLTVSPFDVVFGS
jgi:hypothetical protein